MAWIWLGAQQKTLGIWRQNPTSKVSFASAFLDVLFQIVSVAPACTEGNVTSDVEQFIAACYMALL